MTDSARLPSWLRRPAGTLGDFHDIKALLRRGGLHTVCESARCPNIGECFRAGTATFLLLGDACTRACGFCAVRKGSPSPPDPAEPGEVVRAASLLGLRHVVLTMVTRDDLVDGGAGHVAAVIRALKDAGGAVSEPEQESTTERGALPAGRMQGAPTRRTRSSTLRRRNAAEDPRSHCYAGTPAACQAPRPGRWRRGLSVEVLVSDFGGDFEALVRVLDARPDVLNHNLETVRRLYPVVRPSSDYDRSLDLLARASRHAVSRVKSGLMAGLGETMDEVLEAFTHLRRAGVDIVTIGQYLRPRRSSLGVSRYVAPEEFDMLRERGLAMGFAEVAAGSFVRSSFHADEMFQRVQP